MRRKRILRRILRFWNHDSHFLPLQVTIDDLDPGIVVITVTAARLPMAQLYSLAVQGAFTGQLASAYNPGWDQTTSTVGAAVSSATFVNLDGAAGSLGSAGRDVRLAKDGALRHSAVGAEEGRPIMHEIMRPASHLLPLKHCP